MNAGTVFLTAASSLLAGTFALFSVLGWVKNRDLIAAVSDFGALPPGMAAAGTALLGLFARFRPERLTLRLIPRSIDRSVREYLSFAALGCSVSGALLALSAGFFAAAASCDVFLLLPTAAAAALGAWAPFYSIRKKAADKRREIGGAMPAMITKTVLFLRAGLTVAESWRMISEKTGGVLGEEMRRTSEEIKNGASLQDAFAAFAVRCDEKTAARFSWLISRNLLKGDGGLSEVLADFGNEIWEERKALARERGGAASNALVLPLIIIFIGILMQIAIPLLGGSLL